jgi:hypothetical protein
MPSSDIEVTAALRSRRHVASGTQQFDNLPILQRLLTLLAVRNAVKGGLDESILLEVPNRDALLAVLAANELRDDDARAAWRVDLRPVAPADLEVIYRAWCDPVAGSLWRSAGSTPSWEDLQGELWAGTDTLLVAADRYTQGPAALLCSYADNTADGWVYAALLRLDLTRDAGPFVALEGLYLLMEKIFGTHPYRKVMFELPTPNMWIADGMLDAGDISVFPRHRYSNGEWCDVAHLHVWRSRWEEATEIVRMPPSELPGYLRRTLAP